MMKQKHRRLAAGWIDAEIIEDLEAALEQFAEIAADLGSFTPAGTLRWSGRNKPPFVREITRFPGRVYDAIPMLTRLGWAIDARVSSGSDQDNFLI